MSHAVSLMNAFAASWADALVRASWQGGLLIALVWLLCRLWPALPANPRGWLWRLAHAKLLLGLVWLPPLALPLLPKPPAAPPAAQATALPVPALPDDAPLLPAEPAPPPSAAPSFPLAAPQPPPAAAPALPPRPTLPTVQTWLLAAWLLGVFAGLGRVAAAWRRACALSRAGRPLADEALQADAADLGRRLGLPHVPPLLVADGLASPLLLGLTRPAILLPAFVLTDAPRSELRLMLAHELAHLMRRDLLWNALPLFAQRLFFFHPLVWLAGHEWALAQEIACDALAIETTGTPPSAYGRMLLGIATRRPSAAPLFPTLAVAAPRHTLRRRLHAMQHIGIISRPRLILAAALTTLLAVGGLLPWRVVAQSEAPASVSPAASQTEDAMMEKNRVEIASRSAKLDAEFADFLKHLSPAQQKKAQAATAFLTADTAHDQQHVQMLEQHRAAYVAAHPNRLTAAQIAEVQRINWQIREPDRISEGIRWEQIIKGKLQAHLAASRDARSRTGWQRQITAIDHRRREAERHIRELEPSIARQKAELETIPADQRARMARVRSYDSEISAYRNIAVMGKEAELSLLRQRITGKFPAKRQNGGATTQTSSAPPKAKTASFNAVVIGGSPPLHLAQSLAESVPPGVTQTQPMWQEEERKEQADLASWNAKSDAQLTEVQKHLSPAQLTKVQPEIDKINADYAKEQQSVQILEKNRAEYVATHPNRLTDAQIAEVEQLKRHISEPDRIRDGINQRLVIKEALKTRIAATHDMGLRGGWGRQIKAIDERQREDEGRIHGLTPSIARQEARLTAFPADQRERLAMLRRYRFEIMAGRMHAYEQKQVNVFELYVEYVTSKRRPASGSPAKRRSGGATVGAASAPPRTSLATSRASAESVHIVQKLYIFPQRGPEQHIQVFRQDAIGRQLILDRFSSRKPIISPPVPVKAKLLLYVNGKLSKDVITPWRHINKDKLTHSLDRHMLKD